MTDFTPVASVPSLKITDTKIGTGAVVKAGQTVTVTYTGAVASTGIIFQSSQDSSPPYATLNLSDVIKGWQEGIPGMKVGGTRQLLIPANLAYGANPPAGSGIPANAGLVFTILLLKIGS
jgi:FKBP-type peptidyl-prolyl cis-trans isomerase